VQTKGNVDMNTLERVKKLCKERGITVARLEEELEIPKNTIYQWKRISPSLDKIQSIADYFNVSTDYLLGRTNIKNNDLTEKDEKDIHKRLEKIREDVENGEGLAFDGEPMSEEAMESFMDAMEYIVRNTKKINKKFTPKKYRDNDTNE
jgi:transcriptional regulator with XRE-family HTH domain